MKWAMQIKLPCLLAVLINIYGVCIELHSHMSTIIFSHWLISIHIYCYSYVISTVSESTWWRNGKMKTGTCKQLVDSQQQLKKTAWTLWMKIWGKLAGPQWLKVQTTFPHQRSLNGRMYVCFSKEVSQSSFWKFQCENTGRSSLGDLCQAPWCLTDGGRCCPGQSASG